ncbi:MAG TPA: polyprenol monophosphomannose synthase [Pirellulales bacterium]|nr:polyprenol monophosphomannose synthase [Pirellulales bacterium]
MTRTLVVVTTYNERENLPSLVDEVFAHAPQVDLLVVDDNSPDGTGAWVRERATGEPRLKLLARPGKQGQGSAVVAGLRYSIEHGYDAVVSMDADFSHHPRYIRDLLAGLEGDAAADVVIGSRYVPGGGVEGWPLRRRLMSRAVNVYTRLMLGLRARDCSGGFRAYRVARLAQLDFSQIISTGYSFHEEFLWRVKRLGCRIAETPIVFVDRVKGHSKINMHEARTAVRVIFKLGLQNRFGRKPDCDRSRRGD